MPQGKYRVKNKAPIDTKKPKKVTSVRKSELFFLQICCRREPCKPMFVTDCPIAPKKWKYSEQARITKTISKNINRKIEEEIRAAVTDAPKVHFATKKKQNQKRAPAKAPQPSSSKS